VVCARAACGAWVGLLGGPAHAPHSQLHPVSKRVTQVRLAKSAGMAASLSYGLRDDLMICAPRARWP
jgi:hypothetical protein